MSTPTSLARHPIHPILVALPIGLWVFSVVADLVFLLGWGAAVWKDVAFYTLGGGIVGALLAAVPGFVDFFSITDARAGRVALTHMAANLIALAIFVVSFLLRWIDVAGFLAVGLSIVALCALAVAGWYGGELVLVHGMGVKPPRKSSSERGSSPHRRIA
jgi:uncharacterized membrane protein